MSTAALNIFQKLMRRWDVVHPYNAAQVMQLAGTADAAVWENAWQAALSESGLGTVSLGRSRYSFVSLNGHAASHGVNFPQRELGEHLSTEMNRAFDNDTEPPFRPFIIQHENHFYAGLVYQHWLADSTSIRMLIREWFLRVYDPQQVSHQPLPLAQRGYWDTIGPGRGGWGMTESLLDMTRRHIRLRRVQKIDSTALQSYDTRFELISTPANLIDPLRAAARRRQVKVNDIFLAALVEACTLHVPLQPRKNRHDVAVGSVVDLRPYGPANLAETFGLFLGFTNVICQPEELSNFDRILDAVAKQTRLQKSTGVAPASFMWMSAALIVGKLSKPQELYHFYRKELPLAGGLSNVDLSRTWAAQFHPNPIQDYIRISPTGPMTPLAMTTTTLGNQFNIGMTHRTGLISAERGRAVANSFVSRLVSVGAG
jgi:hypothetical protein